MHRSNLLRTAAVVTGAAAALALGASSASAATTFTVKAGSAPSGTTVAVKGVTTGSSPQVTFVDTTSGTTLNCTSSSATGSVKTGTGLSGTGIATINGAGIVFSSCTGPLGLNLTVKGAGTWKLNATSGSTTAVKGTLTGVSATVSGSGCSFSVAGSVAGSYTNSTQALAFPGTTSGLKISNVNGCFGLVNSGDVASYKASYKLTATTAAYNPVKVTAP